MARYIDAEALSRAVVASWDKDNHHSLEASHVHRQEHNHLMRIIEKQPTADVVPKSEYDAVVSAVDNITKEFLKLHDDYQEQNGEIERLRKPLMNTKKQAD